VKVGAAAGIEEGKARVQVHSCRQNAVRGLEIAIHNRVELTVIANALFQLG